MAMNKGKLLVATKRYITIACNKWRSYNWECIAQYRNGSLSAGHFQSLHFGNISLHIVPENGHHDVLYHMTKIFQRDVPQAKCSPPCTAAQRGRDFSLNTRQCICCCVMALGGSTVVGACLNRPLTRDQVMLSLVSPSVGPGTNWLYNCFKYQCMFQLILLGVSDNVLGPTEVCCDKTQSYFSHLRRKTFTLTVTSEWEFSWLGFLNSNWCSLS